MNKRSGRWRLIGSILFGGGLLAGCSGPEGPAAARQASHAPQAAAIAKTAPTVVEAVRYYAGLMARGARLATPASRRFANVEPTEQPAGNASPDYSISLLLAMPAYEVMAFLDHQQRLVDVIIETPRPPEDPHRLAKDVRRPPGHLIRLEKLRRAFGPGTNENEPEAAGECYFTYQPAPDARELTIRAFLPYETRTDSAIVDRIDIFIEPTE